MILSLNNTPPLRKYSGVEPPEGGDFFRYTFLLFEQPADFKIPPKFAPWVGPQATKSTSFDFEGFVAETGLQQPIAANTFFTRK